ncbi:hypothetical protein LAUMK42_03420 [Mycobacterium persicum]|uniref:DUF222 domain-containing protein n=1 Tax=Mycobacterium persicum TaxID=1487726 RepID=A0AB38UVH4_9MYCO|nr:hypothetical protein LAUMK42_03420 [Mycobacterium persicum]
MDWQAVTAAFDRLDAALDVVAGLNFDALSAAQWLTLLQRCEQVRRRIPVPQHQPINHLARQASAAELGGKLSHAIAEWTLISRAEATRRINVAADLGPRRGLSGRPIAPALAATATAQRDAKLGAEHITVIRRFCRQLPGWVDHATRERAEAQLARQASQFRPEQLAELAATLADCLNPDGTYRDEDRARRRGLMLGSQQADGMSALRGLITPELRATLEAVLAKLAAPGMCNPDDEQPAVDGAPLEEAIQHDTRSAAQRHHDGLTAGLRALLASGDLGQHNGAAGQHHRVHHAQGFGGGRRQCADRRRHHPADVGCGPSGPPRPPLPRHLRSRQSRGALSPQAAGLTRTRIVLYAKERGCSAPGCDVKGYYGEVHHVIPFAESPTTDINQPTFACGPHHKLLDNGWTTRKNTHGDTEWLPPTHLDRGQPRTTMHHPEKLLRDGGDDDETE